MFWGVAAGRALSPRVLVGLEEGGAWIMRREGKGWEGRERGREEEKEWVSGEVEG